MCCERDLPFARVLLVRPGGAMNVPISVAAPGKRLGIGGFQRGSSAAGLAGGNGVLAPKQQRPAGARLLTRLGERDGIDGTQAVIALAAAAIAKDPPAALFVCD